MKKTNFKKLLSLALACVMLVVLSVSGIGSVAFAIENVNDGIIYLAENYDGTYFQTSKKGRDVSEIVAVTNEIGDIYKNIECENQFYLKASENVLVSVERFFLSSNDENFISIMNSLDISDECRNSILSSFLDLEQGEYISYNVFIPKYNRASSGNSIERTTYTGYKNQTYYQEYITLEYMTEHSKIIYNKNFGDNTQYLRQQFELIGATAIGSIADYFKGGAISLVDLMVNLFQGDAIATEKIEATLHETQLQKITFLVQIDGIKVFGSNVNMGKDGFMQLVEQTAMVGVTNTEKIFLKERKSANWDKAQDELTYLWCMAGGISDVVDRISFGGQVFG